MGVCASNKKKKNDLALQPKQWPSSPSRRHTGNSFRYGTDLYINLKNGSIDQFYDIGQEIGTGAFGKVNLAIHKIRGTKRALKTLPKDMIINEEKTKLFAEVNVLRKIDHPNIVKLYELYEDKHNYYIVTEYLSGGELVSKIKDQKFFSEQEAAHYMRQILSALQYCHKAKIVHRDLKLENLMLDTSGPNSNLKVIDFGTSRKIIKEEFLTAKYGTPHYTAPEVFSGKYTSKCDVWSAGVILYTLLCGYMPFNGADGRQTQMLIEMNKWSFDDSDWSKISQAAKTLIKKMLTYNPEKRMSAEQAYNDPWIQGNVQHIENLQNVIGRLQNLYKNHIIQDLIMQFITIHVLTEEEKNKVLHSFQQLDQDGDGELNKEDLKEGFKQAGVDQSNTSLIVDQIIEQYDTNQVGSISYHQFLQIMTQQEIKQKISKLEEAFIQFDLDGDGFIKKEDFEQVMGGIIIDENHWNEILTHCDEDKDGMISKEEFIKLLQMQF